MKTRQQEIREIKTRTAKYLDMPVTSKAFKEMWAQGIKASRKTLITGFGQKHSLAGFTETILKRHKEHQTADEIGISLVGTDIYGEYVKNNEYDIQRSFVNERIGKFSRQHGDEFSSLLGMTINEAISSYNAKEISAQALGDAISEVRKALGLEEKYDRTHAKEEELFSKNM